ncbi:MAG: hypothetical protein ACXWP6_06680 [Ktedonobacterales bacterium]
MGLTRGRGSDAGTIAFTRYGVPWTRQGQRILIAAILALLATALLLLADATGAVPSSLLPHTPLHARNAHAIGIAQTPTDTPTATTQPKIPSITLVSPSAGQGPVGAHITISGRDFSGSTATIFAATQPDCSGSQGTLVTPKLSGGSFNTTFIWPTNLGNGTYYLCANGLTSGAPTYQVVASSPPTLSLSVSTAQAGDTVTITGSNFAGYSTGTQISITESAGGTPRTLTSATLGPDGNFSVSETLSKDIVGNNVTITAYSPTDGANTPVLQASASLTVQGSTPTPTVTIAPTPTTSGNTTPQNTGADNQSGSTGLIVLLIVGIVLALLVILGVVAYLVLRGRNGGEPGAGGEYPGGGGYGGYGQGATGRYPQANQYGRAGVFDTPNAYTEPYASPPAGGVSQWDEPEPAPGPDWQPRPMTGYGLTDDDTQNNPYGQYPDYPAGTSQQPARQGTYPPVDPWDTPSSQPGRTSGTGYPPGPNPRGTTGRTRATGGTGAAPQPRPQPGGWDDEPTDDGWGGSGVTRPANNKPNQWDQPRGNEPGW